MPYARKNGCNCYDGKITKLTERLNWNVNRDDIALRCIFHYVNLIFIVMQICNYLSVLKFIQRTCREQGFMSYTGENKSYSFRSTFCHVHSEYINVCEIFCGSKRKPV